LGEAYYGRKKQLRKSYGETIEGIKGFIDRLFGRVGPLPTLADYSHAQG